MTAPSLFIPDSFLPSLLSPFIPLYNLVTCRRTAFECTHARALALLGLPRVSVINPSKQCNPFIKYHVIPCHIILCHTKTALSFPHPLPVDHRSFVARSRISCNLLLIPSIYIYPFMSYSTKGHLSPSGLYRRARLVGIAFYWRKESSTFRYAFHPRPRCVRKPPHGFFSPFTCPLESRPSPFHDHTHTYSTTTRRYGRGRSRDEEATLRGEEDERAVYHCG